MCMCQCPERGDLHFYQDEMVEKHAGIRCVNALKGATSISTVYGNSTDQWRKRVSMP